MLLLCRFLLNKTFSMLHPSGRCIFSITFGVPGWIVQSSARLNVFGWVGARSNELKDEATFLRSLRRRFFESRYKPEASHHGGHGGDHAEASSKINKELSADLLTSRRSTRIPHRSICSVMDDQDRGERRAR